jgi:hypothetical protein
MNVILDELWVEMLVPWNKLEEMAYRKSYVMVSRRYARRYRY